MSQKPYRHILTIRPGEAREVEVVYPAEVDAGEREHRERLGDKLTAVYAADPGREALADQADAIDLRRLERALTIMGCAGPVSQEECAASLGDFVNRLTAAVERFGR